MQEKEREEETGSKNRKRIIVRAKRSTLFRPGQKLFKDVEEGSMEREEKRGKEGVLDQRTEQPIQRIHFITYSSCKQRDGREKGKKLEGNQM